MKTYQKTKNELIQELEILCQQVGKLSAKIAEMEKQTDAQPQKPVSRAPRKEMDASIEFIADFDIVEAKGINISESGICFELTEDLPFEMQFTLDSNLHRHRAHLIWVKRLPDGGYRFGLKFVEPETYPAF